MLGFLFINSQMLYLNDDIGSLDLDKALGQLSAQRREQALKFKHELGQRLCAAAYLLLCEGLRTEYGISELPILNYEEDGKPTLVNHPDIHFNLSHCKSAVVCALSSHPIGVDVEQIRRYNESLVRYTMNEQEIKMIEASDRPDVTFIRLWTMKEAKLKRLGTGIRKDMKDVLSPDDRFLTLVNTEKGYVISVSEAPETETVGNQ